MPDDLKTRDIARLLRVSEETVRQYAREGRIPFQTTPGGHRRFDGDAVLAALGQERGAVSIGPAEFALPAGTTSINFGAPAPRAAMAVEVAALAGSERREPLPAPMATNRVHASLMRWAQPARVPLGAGH
jgi:excisionase family DNA binding protein